MFSWVILTHSFVRVVWIFDCLLGLPVFTIFFCFWIFVFVKEIFFLLNLFYFLRWTNIHNSSNAIKNSFSRSTFFHIFFYKCSPFDISRFDSVDLSSGLLFRCSMAFNAIINYKLELKFYNSFLHGRIPFIRAK